MYDKTFALVAFGIVLVQFIVFILPYWKINDKKDLISEGFEAFEGTKTQNFKFNFQIIFFQNLIFRFMVSLL